jgi:replicative DNA helicase
MESEQGILGCILLSPKDCIVDCIRKFGENERVFYDLRHQLLYRTMVEMWNDIEPIDLITLQQTLKDRKQLEDIGGLAYLCTLPDATPAATNLDYYLDIVWEKYILRKVVQTCTGIVGQVFDYEGEVDALLDEVETDILKIGMERRTKAMLSIRELVQRAVGRIEQYHQNQGALTGISTGFHDFDKMTAGMHGGEMIVIAGRPSMGKTSLAMNIADHVAVELKLPVGVFSLEMTADQLTERMICSRARVNLKNIREGFLTERDFPRLTGAASKIASAPLHIDDTSGLSILQLRARARQMWQSYGIKMFVIDYLGLLHTTNRKAKNRQEEVSDVSDGIKALAKELDLPIIVLVQLNREVEKRGDGARPRLSDLRESGSVEQNADLVGLLFREKKKDGDESEDAEQDALPVTLYIGKQRNGPTGDVDLTFLKQFTRFESAAKVDAQDMPDYKSPHND